MSSDFCATISAGHHETLAGTALEALRFVVCLEVNAAWPAKMMRAKLPVEVLSQLEALEARPGVRVQFIRRPDRERTGGTKLLVADLGTSTVHSWNLSGLDGMCSLDWAAVDRNQPPAGGNTLDVPLILVCTHGRRDACCAKWGMALWRSLLAAERQRSVSLWQTSHLGGHRFAATCLVLPGGYQYGRLHAEDGPEFLGSVVSDRLYLLDRLRGRITWDRAAQAADVFRRITVGDRDPWSTVGAVVAPLEGSPAASAGTHPVRVQLSLRDGACVEARVERQTDQGRQRPPSCGKAPEPVSSYTTSA